MKRLYRITVRGFTGNDSVFYAIAENSDEAYRTVRSYLDKKDWGFAKDRALAQAELLAEDSDYPECETRLFS